MQDALWGDQQTQFFFELTPERVMDALEALALRPTGRCIALNSFENRVYDVEIECEQDNLQDKHLWANRRVLKFYRPGRWTEEQILEEHQFLSDLVKAEIPAIAPIAFGGDVTLHQMQVGQIWYAVFPKCGGRAPDELSPEQVRWIGRLLARIHNVGAARESRHRIKLNPGTYGRKNLEYLLSEGWIPPDFKSRYQKVVEDICKLIEPWFAGVSMQRIHGDCHLGNLLWNQNGPFFLDFDDMVRGPVVQDLWLLLSGRAAEGQRQLDILLEGYEELRSFDRSTLKLIEPLRALRFINYSAWIARRWKDPAFPQAFPQFGSHRYWSDETGDLESQLEMIKRLEAASF
jgi:Ser/Thr protein kinase RdoA (MazF antagonist)